MIFTRPNLNTMSPDHLAKNIAESLGIPAPNITITGTVVTVLGTGVTPVNQVAIQALINSYTYDPNWDVDPASVPATIRDLLDIIEDLPTDAELAAKADAVHKARHATGGADALGPSDIGAAASGHTHAPSAPAAHKSTHATGGSDALAPADIGAATSGHTHPPDAPAAHKSTHVSGGSDPLTPADIGAAAAAHVHAQPLTVAKKGADQALTAVALADVADLSFPMAANSDYEFEALIAWSSAAATTGVWFSINGPAGLIELTATVETQLTQTTWDTKTVTAYNGGAVTGSIDAANARRLCRIKGIVRNGPTAGNLVLRGATEVANSAISVKRGSTLKVV